jgi:transcriptional regulator with XRE-family HTH domain
VFTEHPRNSQIRSWRETLGYSLNDFAARADVTPSFLSRLERGERCLTLGVAARILRAFGAVGIQSDRPGFDVQDRP